MKGRDIIGRRHETVEMSNVDLGTQQYHHVGHNNTAQISGTVPSVHGPEVRGRNSSSETRLSSSRLLVLQHLLEYPQQLHEQDEQMSSSSSSKYDHTPPAATKYTLFEQTGRLCCAANEQRGE